MQKEKCLTNAEIVEELTSSIESIANLCNSLHGLSGKLSSLANQCNDIKKVCSSIQSKTDLSKKYLLDLNIDSYECESSYILKDELNKLDNIDYGDSQLAPIKPEWKWKCFNGFNYSSVSCERTVKIILNIVRMASDYGGFVFGGFVRDILIPRFILSEHKMDFGDVNIWFQSKKHIVNFLNHIRNTKGVFSLKPYKNKDTEGTVGKVKSTYSLDFDNQYILYFCDMEIAIVNLVASKYFPVNDFDVNLLFFTPKDINEAKIDISWFEVGHTEEKDHEGYKVDEVVKYIKNKEFDTILGYANNMDTFEKERIKRMKQWGWKYFDPELQIYTCK